jgi:uncharacterized protein (TIGR04168 family)
VGDIHDQWSVDDAEALHQLRVDLVLFVGDFGNEAVALVRQIAAVEIPKAVILGNHDAWYTATDWGRKKCPYDRTQEDRVAQQLQALGETHVGYGKLDLPHLGLSVVGGRPFSWGGSEWKYSRFYQERFAISDFEASLPASNNQLMTYPGLSDLSGTLRSNRSGRCPGRSLWARLATPGGRLW